MADVASKRVDPLALLAAIPQEQIEQMRRTLADHAHAMQYSAVDTAALPAALASDVGRDVGSGAPSRAEPERSAEGGARTTPPRPPRTPPRTPRPPRPPRFADAFDIALERAWQRATDADAVESGRLTQV